MRRGVGFFGAAASVGLFFIGSQPQPAVAFACSSVAYCTGGCKTVLDPHGENEGVHVCYSGCSYPGCGETGPMAIAPEVESLIQNTTKGDIKAAVRLATKYPVSVRYYADRHALMYYSGCTGDVPIGVQPLTLGQNEAVAAAVAD